MNLLGGERQRMVLPRKGNWIGQVRYKTWELFDASHCVDSLVLRLRIDEMRSSELCDEESDECVEEAMRARCCRTIHARLPDLGMLTKCFCR